MLEVVREGEIDHSAVVVCACTRSANPLKGSPACTLLSLLSTASQLAGSYNIGEALCLGTIVRLS